MSFEYRPEIVWEQTHNGMYRASYRYMARFNPPFTHLEPKEPEMAKALSSTPGAVRKRYNNHMRLIQESTTKSEKGARRHLARHSNDLALRAYAQAASKRRSESHGQTS